MSGWPRTIGITLLCGTTFASCSGAAFADDRHAAEGAALFNGSAPIVARLAGDADALPSLASRCVNCHERSTRGIAGIDASLKASSTNALKARTSTPSSVPAGTPSAATSSAGRRGGTYASLLDAAWLTTLRVRHGGPATRYDEASFCTLIRSGVDPAQVLVPPVMPRYDATDEQCESLWTFLGSR